MSRDILDAMSSPALLIVQLTASVGVLLLMALREGPRSHFKAPLAWASLTGILEPGLAYTVGLLGLSMTTAGHAAVISSAEPIFIILLGWIFFRNRPTRRLACCIALAVFGLALIPGGAEEGAGTGRALGDFLVVIATLFAAGYVVLSARLAIDFPAATLAAAQQLVGLILAIVVCVLAICVGIAPPLWHGIDAGTVLYAAFSGVVQYAIPFWLYLIGLRLLSAGAAGLYLTLTPVFGVAGAYFWLGEQPQPSMLVGAVLILAAVLAGHTER